jgi:hypothetical protein
MVTSISMSSMREGSLFGGESKSQADTRQAVLSCSGFSSRTSAGFGVAPVQRWGQWQWQWVARWLGWVDAASREHTPRRAPTQLEGASSSSHRTAQHSTARRKLDRGRALHIGQLCMTLEAKVRSHWITLDRDARHHRDWHFSIFPAEWYKKSPQRVLFVFVLKAQWDWIVKRLS